MSTRVTITEGRMQVKLEAALEHTNSLSYRLHQIEFKYDTELTKDARYHLKAIDDYITEVSRAMQALWGSIEGQLCPYEDCLHDLAFNSVGWWRCPHCNRAFFAQDADGIEDYHCRKPGETGVIGPKDEDVLRFARDLGPSYASSDRVRED